MFTSNIGDCDITIEQIPEYEGALVFDGVDDYAICDTMPIFDDYTIICRRIAINNLGYIAVKNTTGLNSAFHFEGRLNTFSMGQQNTIINHTGEISYQTLNSYNGKYISSGTKLDSTYVQLMHYNISYSKGAIYWFALYDKSLTPEEIEQEKVKLEAEWSKRLNEIALPQ